MNKLLKACSWLFLGIYADDRQDEELSRLCSLRAYPNKFYG
jgi:hypothetical protein